MSDRSFRYAEIKDEILRRYLAFAFDRGARLAWPIEQVVGSVDYECEVLFEDALSKAMASTVYLALSWNASLVFNGKPRSHLLELLDGTEVRDALKKREASEREDFLRDLDALGITPPWAASLAS
jgi:hypothetical protein